MNAMAMLGNGYFLCFKVEEVVEKISILLHHNGEKRSQNNRFGPMHLRYCKTHCIGKMLLLTIHQMSHIEHHGMTWRVVSWELWHLLHCTFFHPFQKSLEVVKIMLKKSPFFRTCCINNNLAQVMSKKSLKHTKILTMKITTSPISNKGVHNYESIILHGYHVGAWTFVDVELLFNKLQLTHS